MREQVKTVPRRRMLGMFLGGGGLAVLGGSAFAQKTERVLTPEVGMGPFYPVLKPLDRDADLTAVGGKTGRAAGLVVHVAGRVLDQRGRPLAGAKIEIWQANTHGRYTHPGDPNAAPLDPNFQGYAVLTTDGEGRYRFKTVKPGAYPVSPTQIRPPHIHFQVEGQADRLVSQMFFPGEPLNDKDALFQNLSSRSEKEAVVARTLPPTNEIEQGATLLGWDIVLQNG
jgi:protocatechuate 3,4-dioxygenase beta subunit